MKTSDFAARLWFALRKNLQLKRAHPWATVLEILLPSVFVAVLIIIRTMTQTYKPPNVAYNCGNSFPFYGTESLIVGGSLDLNLMFCGVKPETCEASSYYRKRVPLELGPLTLPFSVRLGYTASSNNFPFYTYAVADKSLFFEQTGFDNPSLPFPALIQKLSEHNVTFAIAPKTKDEQLTAEAEQLQAYLEQVIIDAGRPQDVKVFKFFDNDNALEDYVTDRNYDDKHYKDGKVAMGVVLDAVDRNTHQWEYDIRMNYSYPKDEEEPTVACLHGCDFKYGIPKTSQVTDDLTIPQTMNYLYGYAYSGFLTVQQVVDQYIIFQETNRTVAFEASISLMPTEDYVSGNFWGVVRDITGMLLTLAFLYPLAQFVRLLVVEKETGKRAMIKLMGLNNVAYNASWFISLFVEMIVICAVLTAVLGPTLYIHSDKGRIFAMFLVFGLATIGFAFMLSAIFYQSKAAALIAPLIFFLCYLPYYAVDDPEFGTRTKMAACLLAPTCFGLGARVVNMLEGGLAGLTSVNDSLKVENISYDAVIGMLALDFVLYSLLGWYLDKVLHSERGGRQPFYFMCTSTFWRGKRKHHYPPCKESHPELSVRVEHVPYELRSQVNDKRCIEIAGLSKAFGRGRFRKYAVDDVHLELYENQITVLLGHNGAGKSTLIDMLAGLLSPTSGTAWVRGKNIQTDVKEIQRELGLCPQSNAIYPELTVMQHLTMSAAFRGVPYEKIEATARAMVQEIGLEDKADVESGKLSGGMKRKLCLGMALIGDPKVVILDEPTSGMDPYSRRAVWEFLQRHKRGRVILLTTHYMDEADHLGDRIAIMAKGRLQCCGSPLYLKNLHGVGYTLTIVRDEAVDTNEDIQKLLQTFMPAAELLSIAGTELTFRLPSDSTHQYADVLSALDMHAADLGVLSYGVRLTMLEEVFLRIGRDGTHVTPLQREFTAETKEALNEPYSKRADSSEGEKQIEMADLAAKDTEDVEQCKPLADHALWKSRRHEVSAFTAFCRHFEALFRKRAVHAKRDVKMVACQLMLPIAFMSMALALLQFQVDRNQPRLELSGNIQNRAIEPQYRNPVPFNGLGPVGQAIQSRFDSDRIKGYAVDMEQMPDQFKGCAQGGEELTDMSNYLIATIGPREEKGASRYGAVTIAQTANLTTFQYNVMVNGSSLHGAAIYPNLLHTALLQELLQDDGAEIRIASHPLPRTFRQEHTDASLSAFTATLLLLIAFAFIPVMYVSYVVRERELKAKEQQFISGMSLAAYWTAMFVWDLLCYVIPVLVTLGIWFAFDIDISEGAFYAVLLVYGPCIITSTYAFSFLFTSRATAENAVLYLNLLTGFCLTVVSYLLVASPVTTGDSRFVRYLFRIFPSYCLGDGLMYLSFCLDMTSCPRITADGPDYLNPIGPMHWDIVMADITFMVILTVVNIIAIFAIECVRVHPWFERLWDGDLSALENTPEVPLDDDVKREAERVLQGRAADDVVRLENVTKVYSNSHVAVRSLTFGIHSGECFGFLGNNGAGKSTTFSILCGELIPTAGRAFVAGHDVQQERRTVRHLIGYCPQFDGLFELLTIREHINFYGRIKCLPPAVLPEVTNNLLRELDLMKHADVPVCYLSGGDRRRVTVALALIGQPPIVFLDEPSSGMDPIGRRFLWDAISRISTHERTSSVVLCTHSMEEAEALCTRIGIMVAGQLRCIGSAQHLKNKFGKGYEVELRTRMPTPTEINSLVSKVVHWRFVSSGALDGMLRGPLSACAEALGNPTRAAELTEHGRGAALVADLEAAGSVSIRAFCEWWLAMDFADRVENFMDEKFKDHAILLDHSQRTFRYRIVKPDMSLSDLFADLEAHKTGICVESYSLGQTTLEQVFDQVAGDDEDDSCV